MIDANTLHWIDEHIYDDPIKLRLKYNSKGNDIDDIDYNEAILQIECRQHFRNKLEDTLASFPGFYFPNKLAGEQSTSDLLAKFHSTLIIQEQPLVDLTAGLGIDAMHCSRTACVTTAVERDPRLCQALKYNATHLGCTNFTVINDDCVKYLNQIGNTSVGTIFIDPARRSTDGKRVFSLNDCQPDITTMLTTIKAKCRRLVVKMSPMLDISHTLNALDGNCTQIIALGTTTECKELIAVCNFDINSIDATTTIKSITLTADKKIEFSYINKYKGNMPISNPIDGDYIYEPYPATMKIGAMPLIAAHYGLKAFHPNTRLLHSDNFIEGFPGDCYKIVKVIEYTSKDIKHIHNEYSQMCVTTRNFGISADQLRKQLKVRDGGDTRLFAVTGTKNKKLMIIAKQPY